MRADAERCQNCADRDGCLVKGALIFMLYIQTGRYDELPQDSEDWNARPLCQFGRGKGKLRKGETHPKCSGIDTNR